MLNRADNVVSHCATKWVGVGTACTIDRSYGQDLAVKADAFASEAAADKAMRTTLVTPGGLVLDWYGDVVQSVVMAGDLFAP